MASDMESVRLERRGAPWASWAGPLGAAGLCTGQILHGRVPLLSTRNYHSAVYQIHSNTKQKPWIKPCVCTQSCPTLSRSHGL